MDDEQPALVCARLIESMRSLQLSTVGPDGVRYCCGYMPFLHQATKSFYIFVSQLAAHNRHLLANPTVAIMIIADEQSTSQIFDRTRVSYVRKAERLAPGCPDYDSILDAYELRHGKKAGMLRELSDFVLFQLQPVSGQFVMGFGKAYTLIGENLSIFEHSRTG